MEFSRRLRSALPVSVPPPGSESHVRTDSTRLVQYDYYWHRLKVVVQLVASCREQAAEPRPQFQGAYTFSKSIDTTEGQMYGSDCGASGALTGINPFNPSYDQGPSCFNATHNMHFNFCITYPISNPRTFSVKEGSNGWWFGNIVNVQTGVPLRLY